MAEGGCQCAAIRYAIVGAPMRVSLCHCADCRRSAGASPVAWAAVARRQYRPLKGEPKRHESSPGVFRFFCGTCGTGLTYENEAVLPGIVDVQTMTLDDPDAFPPQAHVQVADRPHFGASVQDLPAFNRFD